MTKIALGLEQAIFFTRACQLWVNSRFLSSKLVFRKKSLSPIFWNPACAGMTIRQLI